MTPLRPESRLIALIVATSFFMQGLDTSIMNTSLPQMALSLGVAPLDLSQGITLYMLSAAAFVPLCGWLADRFGERRIFVISILIFTGASLLCGIAQNLWEFTAARILQGLGGALMTPVGRMIVLRNADKSELLHATALITWPALAAPIIGPALGGFITTYISWRWNFLLNVPLGIAGIVMIMRHIPKAEAAHANQLDWSGLVLSAVALIAMLYGLELLSHARIDWVAYEWTLPIVLTLLGVGFSWLSIRHFQRTTQPLLELSTASVQTYRMSTLTAGACFRTAIHATPFLLPLLFQVGFGMNALGAGSLLLIYFVGNLGIKPITSPILTRFGFRTVLLVNGCLAGAAIMLCAIFAADTPRWQMIPILLLAGATRSMQFTCLNTMAFADTTPAQRSSSTTLFGMFNQVANVLGVALSTLVINLSLFVMPYMQAGIAEIRYGFIAMGLLAIGSALMFVKLPKDAGAEVSGHQPRTR
ncbi:MAG: MFS transporter [Steroidobacteraceae bacterium]